MVSFPVFLVTAILAITLPRFSTAQENSYWTGLLEVEDIFPINIAPPPPTATNEDVVQELTSVLSSPPVRSEIYDNYEKVYKSNGPESDGNRTEREDTFADRLINIATHNLKNNDGETSWRKGVNPFSDMKPAELMTKFTGQLPIPPKSRNDTLYPSVNRNLKASGPSSLDWRNSKIVTPPKQQGNCGSCCSFAVAGVVEAVIARKTKKQLDTSEQELVDCADQKNGKGTGCNGYWYTTPLDYIKNKGVTSEKAYKYEAKNGACRASGKSRIARISNYGQFNPASDEDALTDGLYNNGPMTAYVMTSSDWFNYKSGVYTGSCGDGAHAVSLVGYGNMDGLDHWIIKNSWGTSWGSGGFMYFLRGENKCRVSDYNYYAVA